MPRNKVQQRARAKREREKSERRRAEKMRKIRIAATVLSVVAIALVMFFVLKNKPAAKKSVSPGTTSTSTSTVAGGCPTRTANPKATHTYASAPKMTIDSAKSYTATVTTSLGAIKLALDAKNAPIAVNNFVFLACNGYYDGTIFHRVIPNFMIQGGDPKGTGQGGPGYKFKNETHPSDNFNKAGLLAMANAGPDTNGSQFFVTVAAYPSLNGSYTIFGHVLAGQAVADKISKLPRDGSDRPNTPPVIQTITIAVS